MSTYTDGGQRRSLRQRNTSAMFRAEVGATTENDRAEQRIMEDPPRGWTGSKAGTSTALLLLVLAIGGVAFFALSGDTTAPSRRLEAEAEDKAGKRELRENLSHDDPRWTAPRADGRCGPAFGPSMVYAGSSLIFHIHG